MSGDNYQESPINFDRPPIWTLNSPTTPGAQELLSVNIEIMEVDNETEEPCHPEFIILEEPAGILERPLALSEDPGIGYNH
ncbi:hypothetical protein AYI69_g4894 [Smittium culicis]|uniref:Uncharacterized protein n=1 Tax=Smittium culicis TaxID=133412 RepID=A0A1R1YAK0_9FUNG|nr:hypothetical protein AYI69_g4894 [Smittium culicis]